MKILTYTTLFPNAVDPNHGIFIENRILHFTRHYGHELRVVAPVPFFPKLRIFPRWHRFSQVPRQELRQDVAVFHPRYLVTPKLGMMLYGWSMFLGTLGTVRRLQRNFDFSAIDAHFLYPDAFAAILLGRVFQRPVVVSARGSDVNSYIRMAGIRTLLRFVVRRAAAVITVSGALKDLVAQLGIPKEKIRVIGNGVDRSNFYPVDQQAARKKLQLPSDRTLLLTTAKIDEAKGIHHLIDAMSELSSQRSDLMLLVAGNNSSAAYAKRLQEQIDRLHLGEVIRFVGPQAHASLRDWYSSCDLFCLASSREGWPNVLLEAMACGKPVVASRVGGIPEVVASPCYGLLIDSPSGTGFAEVIQAALGRNWDTQKIVNHARRHGWEAVSAKQQGLFREVVASEGMIGLPAGAPTHN